MNEERLLKLADYLETVPERAFNMAAWRDECGTSGCALGHACEIPEFAAIGLKIEFCRKARIYMPVLNGSHGYAAAEALFGIDGDEAEYLFNPWRYSFFKRCAEITPQAVAARIREFVHQR